MRTNYILIDYENVQPDIPPVLLDKQYFSIIVFVGAKQDKIDFTIANVLQQLGERASYVRISATGPNALDFHIAFYIGQIVASEPNSFFHIISKDTGFDPLIAHLKTKNIFSARFCEVMEIPALKAASSKNPTEQIEIITKKLEAMGAAKPVTVKKLSNTINSLFHNMLSEEELGTLLATMKQHNIITINNAQIQYPSSAESKTEQAKNAESKAEQAKNAESKTEQAKSPAKRIASIVANLKTRGTSKPRTVETLSNTINSLFHNTLSQGELSALLNVMKQKKLISVHDTKVSYSLPS